MDCTPNRPALIAQRDVNLFGKYVAGRDIHVHPRREPKRPKQAPSPPADFVGREYELELLTERFGGKNDAPAIICISGEPGVGKSALAAAFCNKVASSYPDGQLYADIGTFSGTTVSPASILDYFLATLDPEEAVPPSLSQKASNFRSLTAGRRFLILIDDAGTTKDVTSLLPGDIGSLTVVTSRSRLGMVPGSRSLRLRAMIDADAAELLRRVSGIQDIPEAQMRDLLALCGKLPLAVRILGSRIAASAAPTLNGRLSQHASKTGSKLQVLQSGDVKLRDVFMGSYELLDEVQRPAFRSLGLTRSSFAPWLLAEVGGYPLDTAEEILQSLAELSLIEPSGTDDSTGHARYELHDLIREFALDLMRAAEGLEGTERISKNLVASYLSATEQIAPFLGDRNDSTARRYGPSFSLPNAGEIAVDNAAQWFVAEHDGLLAAFDIATSLGDSDETVVRLARSLHPHMQRRCAWSDSEHVVQTALRKAEASGRRSDVRALLQDAAASFRSQARWTEAIQAIEASLNNAIAQGGLETAERLSAMLSLGVAHRNSGELELAQSTFRECKNILANTPEDIWSTAATERGLGLVHQAREEWEYALPYFRRSADLFRQAGDDGRRAMSLTRLGACLRGAGEPDQALALYEDTAQTFLLTRNDSWVGIVGVHRAAAALDLRRHEDCFRYLNVAGRIFSELRDRRWTAICALHMGRAFRELDQLDHARAKTSEAVDNFSLLGDALGLGAALVDLAVLNLTVDVESARTELADAEGIFSRRGCRSAVRRIRVLATELK